MATKPPGNLGNDPTPPKNNDHDSGILSGGYASDEADTTDVGLDDDEPDTDAPEVLDADHDGEAEEVEETETEQPESGLAIIPKTGVARRAQGMQVSHRADQGGYKAKSASLGEEPKLLNKAYDITKAAIKDGIMHASYTESLMYQDMQPVRRQFSMGGGLPVHPDLTRCFQKLVPFMAHVTEQVMATPYELERDQELPDLWSNFVVNKVAITDAGIVISGYRKLKGNRRLVVNTPFIDFDADRESWYRHAQVVEHLANELKAEVALALEGKAFNPQLNLFEQEEAAA